MAKSQELEAQKAAQLPAVINYMEDAGAGLENATSEDKSIPFLRILQALSPQLNKTESVYIKGAEAGDIINTVSGKLYKGDGGVIVVPAQYQRVYTEWNTREDGGGLVKNWGSDPHALEGVKRNDKGQDITPSGTQITTSGTFYVITTDDGPCVISMSGTQMKKSRKWVTQMSTLQLPRPDGQGKFNPPTFYMAYKLTTVPESNDKGNWYGWKIEPFKPTAEISQDLYHSAREFRKAVSEGLVKAQAEAAPTESDAPF